MTAHHCASVPVTLHHAHAGHLFLDVQCNHVVYAQYICVFQAFLFCSPCLLSLLHLPTASLCFLPLWPQLPWLSSSPSILVCFCLQFPSLFISGSIDLPMAHIGTEWPHVSICASVYVSGWRIWLEFHYLFPWPYTSNLALNTASKTKADHATTRKLIDAYHDVLVAFMQKETLFSLTPRFRLTSLEAPPADACKNIISLANSSETDSLRTKGSRWGFGPSACWESCWARDPSIQRPYLHYK